MSVLVAERVRSTYHGFCTEVVQRGPDVAGLKLLVGVMASFFRLVVRGSGELGYMLSDFHWGNLGILRGEPPDVVVIDLENIRHWPGARPRVQYGGAVRRWMKDIPPPSLVCWVLVS